MKTAESLLKRLGLAATDKKRIAIIDKFIADGDTDCEKLLKELEITAFPEYDIKAAKAWNLEYCCSAFQEFIPFFSWMIMAEEEDNPRVKVMPHVLSENGTRWRVNHCPSCGQYMRNIQIETP